MIYLCRAAEENMPIIGNIFILMKHCEVCLRTIIMIYWRSLCHRQNVRKEATTTNCHLISVLVKLWSFGSYWSENSSYIIYSVLITCSQPTNSLLHTGACRLCWMKFLEILQHLPQLSCCADLIRKPFLAITIINQQETWRFLISFDLIVNLIVDIQTNLVWIWYEVQWPFLLFISLNIKFYSQGSIALTPPHTSHSSVSQ